MNRKKRLEKKLLRAETKKKDLVQRALNSDDAAEVRRINEELAGINEEIQDITDEINELLDESGGEGDEGGSGTDNRSGIPKEAEMRGGTPLQSFAQNTRGVATETEDPLATVEYRNAFKSYVQRGTPISQELLTRAGGDAGTTITADIGVIVPSTIMNEFIKDITKVYGQIYSKVRKLNVKGGVKFPISKLKANFSWITETTVSGKQKAGDINTYVEFSYNIGEIRVAQTLLSEIVSLDLFESNIVEIMVEAYVEAMDKGIISGAGTGQLLGITADPRVTNVVTFTDAEFSDWTAWRKNLFAVIPLSKRGQGEFLFPSSTVESNLLTMADNNNNPIYKQATDLSIGNDGGSFYGRSVTLVEPDVIGDFDTAVDGDVVGIYWVPNDYAVNSNMAFTMKRYFDDNTNEWINKGLVIVDGKILDPAGCYLIKKSVPTP
jgi:HK97 family phage major capsid protein